MKTNLKTLNDIFCDPINDEFDVLRKVEKWGEDFEAELRERAEEYTQSKKRRDLEANLLIKELLGEA